MEFNKWIQFHSNKEFADKYRILKLNEDEEICFFIQYASRAYCSNYAMFTIAAAISDRGKPPYNNNTVYKAYVNINYDTGEAFLAENSKYGESDVTFLTFGNESWLIVILHTSLQIWISSTSGNTLFFFKKKNSSNPPSIKVLTPGSISMFWHTSAAVSPSSSSSRIRHTI